MTSKPANPKPRRRFWQYSLRTLFVLVTVFCVWFGWLTYKANEQRKAVAWVREMGGRAYYDYESFDELGMNIGEFEPPGPAWLDRLLGVDYRQEVEGVDLVDTQANDLTPLAGLKNLRWLAIRGTPVSDLTLLARLTGLKELELEYTQVSDLTPLAKLASLEVLFLSNTQVSDITPLAKLTSLQELYLDGTPVSDITPLATLTSLRELYLEGTPVREEQVEELRRALPKCEIFWTPPDPSP